MLSVFLYLEIAINLFCFQGFKTLISVHFNIRATPHKDRLTALYAICLQIFRHIIQKLLD